MVLILWQSVIGSISYLCELRDQRITCKLLEMERIKELCPWALLPEIMKSVLSSSGNCGGEEVRRYLYDTGQILTCHVVKRLIASDHNIFLSTLSLGTTTE